MTAPRTPADQIARSVSNLQAQREAARKLSEEIAQQRADAAATSDSPQSTVTE
jgi:hypothetical protein